MFILLEELWWFCICIRRTVKYWLGQRAVIEFKLFGGQYIYAEILNCYFISFQFVWGHGNKYTWTQGINLIIIVNEQAILGAYSFCSSYFWLNCMFDLFSWFNNIVLGLVPQMMVKFDPRIRTCNSSLQSIIDLLLWDAVIMTQNVTSSIGKYKSGEQLFNYGVTLISLSGTGPWLVRLASLHPFAMFLYQMGTTRPGLTKLTLYILMCMS